MSHELLPCPFCGGTANCDNIDAGIPNPEYWVICADCGATIHTQLKFGIDAATVWNRRAAPPAQAVWREPTEAMVQAGVKRHLPQTMSAERLAMLWRAMYDAAPLTRGEATAPSLTPSERHRKNGTCRLHRSDQWCTHCLHDDPRLAASLPQEAPAPSAPKCLDDYVCMMPDNCSSLGYCLADHGDHAPPSAPDVAYPTITRLADLSISTSFYQSHELVSEAVACLYALEREQARANALETGRRDAIGVAAHHQRKEEAAVERAEKAERERENYKTWFGASREECRAVEARLADVADDPSDPSSPIQHLTSLLANIHRDNGQYTWSHGNRQSVLRAYEILDEMRTQAESHRWMTQAKAREDLFFKNAPSPPGAPPRADREPTAAYWRHTILCPAVGNQGACNCQLEEHMRTRIIELEAELVEAQEASHRWMTQATKDFDRAERERDEVELICQDALRLYVDHFDAKVASLQTERAKFEQVMWDEHEKVAALMARAEHAERQLEKFVQDENEELDEANEKIAALDKRIADVVALIDKCASAQAPDSAYRDGVLVALGEIRAALQPNKEKDDA